MSKWIDIKRELFDKPVVICKVCRLEEATHLHHAIISKAKLRDRKKHKLIDHKCNAIEICGKCHITADAYEIRRTAYWVNIARYGQEMKDWYESLPILIKENFDVTPQDSSQNERPVLPASKS